MQEQINEKSVALYIKAGKLTGQVLAKAIAATLRRMKNPKARHGKQSIKSLTRSGANLQSIEITDQNIKSFERVARKYGVDFALKKETGTERWLVLFKAKDADALTAAFQEFTAKTLGKKSEQKRPSLLGQLAKFKETAKNAPAKEKHKDHGGHEL